MGSNEIDNCLLKPLEGVMHHLKILLLLKTLLVLGAQNAIAGEQVPFGDAVSDKIKNYHRHTPFIATSGNFSQGGVAELAQSGFRTIVDLRTAPEGVELNASEAKALGIDYHNLPVGSGFPEAALLSRFGELVEDENNYPMLLRCGSGNRVGMVWAAYKLSLGIPMDQAILEGQTIGMSASREAQLSTFYEDKK